MNRQIAQRKLNNMACGGIWESACRGTRDSIESKYISHGRRDECWIVMVRIIRKSNTRFVKGKTVQL